MPLRFDPINILTRMTEEAGIWGVLAVGLTLVLFVGILVMRARLLAVALLFVAMCFSNFKDPVGTVAVAVRWVSLICLVPLGVPAIMRQGWSVLLLLIYAFLSIAFSVRSYDFLWSLQRGFALVLLIVGVCGSLQILMEKGVRPERLFKGVAVMAVIWAVVNALPLGEYIESSGGERFVGEGASVGYNALVMGVLLPFALWGVFHKWSRFWRIASAGAMALLVILLLFVATRGGAFLGVIACIPLLLRLSFKRLAVGAMVLVIIAGSVAIVLQWVAPSQQSFIYRRYIGFEGRDIATGRRVIWSGGFNMCMESPLMGHGSGTAVIVGPSAISGRGLPVTTFHNAYLTVWYESSLFGLAVFVIAFLVTIRRGLIAVIRSRGHPELQLVTRLVLGVTLGLGAFGLVENSISSATNLIIGMYLMTTVLIQGFWIRTSPAYIQEEALLRGEYQSDPYAADPAAEAF